jgi:hypothetical protein
VRQVGHLPSITSKKLKQAEQAARRGKARNMFDFVLEGTERSLDDGI